MSERPGRLIGALVLVEALWIGGLWWAGQGQLAAMNKAVNDIAELKDPSPFRAALMGHLGKIHLGMEGYLRSPSDSILEQVAQSRKDFTISMPEFERQNPKLFPKAAVEEIARSFKTFQESVDHTLEVNAKWRETRNALEQNFTHLIFLIEHNLRPLIRSDQADAEERSDAVLNILNQGRAWQQNLVKAWEDPTHNATELTLENDNRGETYLERYARMELLARERKVQKEVAKLWQANSDLARESFARQQLMRESSGFMDAQRNQVISVLNRYLPALPPAELAAQRRTFTNSLRLHGLIILLLALVGTASLWLTATSVTRVRHGGPLIPPRKPRPAAPVTAADDDLALEPTLKMNLQGMITEWTDSAERLYGYAAREIRGQPVSKLFESESEIGRLYQELVERPNTVFETIHKLKSGNVVPVKIEFRPIADAGGKPKAIGLICTRR
jgi:PAS domain S-box-containing protein